MNLKTLFLGALASVGLAGTASAAYVPATWTDTYDVGTGVYIGAGDSYSYFHDITFDGFNVGSDVVTAFNLSIDLFDDEKSWWDLEIPFVDLPGITGDSFVWDFGAKAYQGWSLAGIVELNTFGTLSVTIRSVCVIICGDFIFGGSELVAKGYSNVAQVPEPSTLGVFGLGLLGIAFASRRRRRR